MSPDFHFLPPCCIKNKLPIAFRQSIDNSFFFYTHGDVVIEEFFKAAAPFFNSAPVLVLNARIVNEQLLHYLLHCFDRGWISDLILSTHVDKRDTVQGILRPYRTHVLYTCSKEVSHDNAHMVLYNRFSALAISGPMYSTVSDMKVTTVAYSAFFYENIDIFSRSECGNPLLNILLPDVMRHRKFIKQSERQHLDPEIQLFLEHTFPPHQNQG